MSVEEYKEIYEAGADGVTVYQETYDKKRYAELHIKGPKRNYDYRYNTPERIAEAGMRSISMGVLLGLSRIDEDIYMLFKHLEHMQKNYPGVEYSLSFPRIIPIKNYKSDIYSADDITLIKLICLARILFPTVGINLSTRESAFLRDNALKLGITRISAASKTTVGGYSSEKDETPQFDVMDHRSVKEVREMIKSQGLDPVFTDWRRI
jgi:2-iminoacetate synthase